MNYLRIGSAKDLNNPQERKLYRAFEIFPGAFSWLTLIGAVFFSWLAPFLVFRLFVGFVIIWFLIGAYFSIHLQVAFKKMRVCEKIDWTSKLNRLPRSGYSVPVQNWKEMYHLISIPNYKEPFEVISASLQSIVNNDYPTEKTIVVLSFEKRAGNERKEVARKLEQEFSGKFFKLFVTFHPDGLPGEIPGHASNDTWAVKQVKKEIIDPLGIPYEKIIVTFADTDTRFPSRYFSYLTYRYLTHSQPERTSFQPIPLFNNNIWAAPFFSQTSSFSNSFWQIICQERGPDSLITFSTHSMSFKTLLEIGYKQPNIIADDSRIFWQCFFKFNGNYRVEPLFYSVSMDSNVGKNFFQTLKHIYKQKKRWAYGVEDIPYFLFACLKNKATPLRKKIYRGALLIYGHWSWATTSILLFTLGWVPIFLGSIDFSHSLVAYTIPRNISRIMTFAMVGLVLSIWISFVLLPPRPKGCGKGRYIVFVLGWLLIPIYMVVINSIPALHAQTDMMLGRYMKKFWVTPKYRKTE